MSAARIIESLGASVSLVGGKLKLAGLDRLDRDTAARVLNVARAHKAEIVAELWEGQTITNGTQLDSLPEDAPLGLRQLRDLLHETSLVLARTPRGQLFVWGKPPLKLDALEFLALMVRECRAELREITGQVPVMDSGFASALLERLEAVHVKEGLYIKPDWRGLSIPEEWPLMAALSLQALHMAASYGQTR